MFGLDKVKKTSSKTKNTALRLCITAMFAALLVGGKEALAAIPNVEMVTLIIASCAFVFGASVAVPAVFVFIALDMVIYGMGTWIIQYIVHWNAVALSFCLLKKLVKNKILTVVLATVIAVVLTAAFGVMTSAVDTVIGFVNGGFFVDFSNFAKRFAAVYVAGISFYVTHVVCNAVLFPVAFYPLVLLFQKAKQRAFPPCEKEVGEQAPDSTDETEQFE